MSLKKDVIGAEVQIGTNQAQAGLTDLAQKTAALTSENEKLRISQAKLKALGKENTDEYKKITAAIAANSKEVKTNQAQMDALRKTLGLSDMSMKQLKKQAMDLRRELSGMNEGADPARWAQLNTQLVATDRQIATVRGTIGTTNSFIGKLGSSLTSIPGPVGAVVQSIGGMGKALWALVANPIGATIAVIVGGLMLLYKAFTSTDSGAVKMEGTLKAIGNVMDILIDRAMSYYKMLWSLVTFDWEGVKKNAKDAFGGITSQIKDAVNAGTDYATVMDDIADREAAAQPRMSKLRAEIEKLKNQSKEANRTSKEKSDLIDLAMAKEIELNQLEKQFLGERTKAENANLASKINNSKMTMEQKQAQLDQWLMIDDKELASAMEKDAAFADFVNKNEAEFQAMQKMKAEAFDKDAEFERETRRLQKSASTEKQALIDEEKARIEAAHKTALEQLESANNEKMAKIIDQYVKEGWTDQRFQAEQLAAEQAYLLLKKAMLEQFGMSAVDVDAQINAKRIEAQKTANAEMQKVISDIEKQSDVAFQAEMDALDIETKNLIDKTNEQLEIRKNAKDQEAQILADKKNQYLDFAMSIGQSFGDLMNDQEATFGDYLKNTLAMALEAFHQWFLIEKMKKIIEGISGGPIKAAIAIAKVAAMEIAYQAVKGQLTKKGKQSGGYGDTGPDDSTPAGIYHANEFIASASAVRNPSVRPVLDVIDMAQRSGTIRSLNLSAILPGRQSGGYSNSVIPNSFRDPSAQSGLTSDDIQLFRQAVDEFKKQKLVVYSEMIKKDIDTLNHIEASRGM